MIERVVLTPRPDGRGLDATLFGALAALLSVSAEVSGNKNPPRRAVGGSTVGGCGGGI